MDFITYTNNNYLLASLFDFVILIIASMIFFQSNKIYCYLREKKYFFFSLAFLSIALAHLFKIFFNFTIAFHKIVIQNAGSFVSEISKLSLVQMFHFLSFTFYRSLFVMGFIILFLVTLEVKKNEEIFLFIYFSAVAMLFSIFLNILFYLTIVILLVFLNLYFYKNHKKLRTKSSFRVFGAFVFILVGSLVSTLNEAYLLSHLISEIFFLIGFVILLTNHLSVSLKNGKEKNKT